ncbi:unnamed protein product [Caenorhabditis bovis]|uniref:Uncharacterized protein n=1 Tax=Caenorhabditis bovis TaxID=2654633 RepID=A0A8S1EYJ3_9PELO|nr:unnamed protein product [Caenorhabditis bovis]
MRQLQYLLSFLILPKCANSSERRTRDVTSEPCNFPLFTYSNFSAFCQISYHKSPYVCDPGGILSRTEVEMLQTTANNHNMTSCFCDTPYTRLRCQRGIKIAVVLLPYVSWQSLRACDPTYTTSSISASTILYAQLLASRWQDHCDADVIFLYIRAWQTERLRTPILIPLFGEKWPHLRRFSIPIVTPSRETTLVSLQNAINHAGRLIHVDSTPVHASIPRWALLFGGIMVIVVVAAIYVANCITQKMGQRKQKLLVPKRGNEKFRAGFGGGVMMNGAGSQKKKSVMMFRTFSKSNSKSSNNNNLL